MMRDITKLYCLEMFVQDVYYFIILWLVIHEKFSSECIRLKKNWNDDNLRYEKDNKKH